MDFAVGGEQFDLVAGGRLKREEPALEQRIDTFLIVHEASVGFQVGSESLGLALDIDDLQIIERRLQGFDLVFVEFLGVAQRGRHGAAADIGQQRVEVPLAGIGLIGHGGVESRIHTESAFSAKDRVIFQLHAFDVEGVEFQQVLFNPIAEFRGELLRIDFDNVDNVLARDANESLVLRLLDDFADDQLSERLAALVLQLDQLADALFSRFGFVLVRGEHAELGVVFADFGRDSQR